MQSRERHDEGGDVTVYKSELVGQLISFRVTSWEPKVVTRYGSTSAVEADLYILTGSHSGARVFGWSVKGAMARQMAAVPLGVRHCARVTSGTTKKGHTWYGIDLDVDQHDRALADEYERWAVRLDDLEEEG